MRMLVPMLMLVLMLMLMLTLGAAPAKVAGAVQWSAVQCSGVQFLGRVQESKDESM